MKISYILSLVGIISTSAWSMEYFCFNNSTSLKQAQQIISGFQLPQDQWQEIGNCLHAELSAGRVELISTMLERHQIKFTSSKTPSTDLNEACKISLKQKKQMKKEILKAEGKINLKAESFVDNEESSQEIYLTEGEISLININEQQMALTCEVVSKNNIYLSLALVKDGTSVTTKLNLKIGDKIDLLKVVGKFSGQSGKVELNKDEIIWNAKLEQGDEQTYHLLEVKN